MTYFEANLEHFDQALGELHTHPNGNGNFSEVFTSSLATTHYIPHAQWRSKSLKDKNHYVREQKNRGIDIINRSFDMANERLKSGNNGFGGMSDRAIGKSVDEKIITFRGGKVREQTSQLTRAHNIATNNASDIDL